MNTKHITRYQIDKRRYWIDQIRSLRQSKGNILEILEQEIDDEINSKGEEALLGHLRLCGAIPEEFQPNSRVEKIYSKYTDIVIARAFHYMGMKSKVLKRRADAADVEIRKDVLSFVADAKAFRLSRSAKNQKDFKVQSLDNWKRGKPYAMIVAPIYQLPPRSSQIYEQAISRSVLIFTYTHLALLVRYSTSVGSLKAISLLHKIFQTLDIINPSKKAYDYWYALNHTLLNYDSNIHSIWLEEKQATMESLMLSKHDALDFLSQERKRILNLSRKEAIRELMSNYKINNKIKIVQALQANEILFVNEK